MTINKWFAGILVAGFLLSCETFQRQEGGNEYYYFPDKNLYYDVSRALYLFSLDSGKTWDSLPGNSESIPEVLGERQVVHSNTDPVWNNNEADREQYNGKLYNIVNDISLKPAESPTKAVIKKNGNKPVMTSEQKETKKRPIKKFFEKIFGKKKKDGQ